VAPSRALRVALLLACCATGVGAQESPALSPRDQEKLAAAYFAADARSTAGIGEQRRLLQQLAGAPELTEAESKAWRKKLEKLWTQGRELEKKAGQAYFWEKEERGLYIVGGETKKPKGLLICMHGGGRGEGDAWSAHGAYNHAADQLHWLAIYPQVLEKTEHGWTDSGTEEFVLGLLDAALRTWKIDRDRVYFAGHSMGGYGTWTLGSAHADRVAALAPSAGAPTPVLGSDGKAIDIEEGIVPNLRNVPIVIYQSDNDLNVPPDANRMAAKKLAEAKARWGGFEFEYWEVPGRAHDVAPGGTEAHLAKIATRVRDAHPQKIVWQPRLAWERQSYWLWWEDPAKGALLVAEADRTLNQVRLECTSEVRGLSLLVDPAVLDPQREIVVLLGDKELFRGRAKRSLATLLATAVRGDPELTFDASVALGP
jgi:dienelactone hydrolase